MVLIPFCTNLSICNAGGDPRAKCFYFLVTILTNATNVKSCFTKYYLLTNTDSNFLNINILDESGTKIYQVFFSQLFIYLNPESNGSDKVAMTHISKLSKLRDKWRNTALLLNQKRRLEKLLNCKKIKLKIIKSRKLNSLVKFKVHSLTKNRHVNTGNY